MTHPPKSIQRRNRTIVIVIVAVALLVSLSLIVVPSLGSKTGNRTGTSSTTMATPSTGLTSNLSSTTSTTSGPAVLLPDSEPGTPVFDAINADVYIPVEGDNVSEISVVSVATNAVLMDVPVGADPQTPAIDSANGYIYVSNMNSGTVSVISPNNTVMATLAVGTSPHEVVFDPINDNIYVANAGNPGNGSVSVISGASNTVIATVILSNDNSSPGVPTVDPLSGNVYVPDDGACGLYVLSVATNTVIASMGLDYYLGTPVFDSANGDFYMTINGGGCTGPGSFGGVLVVSHSTNTVVGTLTLPGSSPVFDSANGDLYFSDGNLITVVASSTNTIVANITTASGGSGGVFDSFNGDIYMGGGYGVEGSSGAPVVYIISGANNSIIQTITIGGVLGQLGVNPISGTVYVPCTTTGTITVISGSTNSILATIPVDYGP